MVASESRLHFINGTETVKSYAALARRGDIFLSLKFLGVSAGAKIGAVGVSYLQVRVRSARDPALAAMLDKKKAPCTVISLAEKQLSLGEAWPNFQFAKVDHQRASVGIGMFVHGDLDTQADIVATRIKEAKLLHKLVDYVSTQAGTDNCIADPGLVGDWLMDQAAPTLNAMIIFANNQKHKAAALKTFASEIASQLEIPGPHEQHLQAIYLKHKQAAGTIILPKGVGETT